MNQLILLFVGVFLDFKIGDPAKWPHPIIFVGRSISWIEKSIRKLGLATYGGGALLWCLVMVFNLGLLWGLGELAKWLSPLAWALYQIYFIFAGMAATCLAKECRQVGRILKEQGLKEARTAIGYLVGRETSQLSGNQILMADLETLAENTIDGVLAPLFYGLVGTFFGHPVLGIFAYKIINTMDSMVGYQNERHGKIGYVAAKMDDLANWLPARLGSGLMLLAGGYVVPEGLSEGRRIYKRDRKAHKSPNAGHPEAVIAGLLGLTFGGAHTYFGQVVDKPTIGEGKRQPTQNDIERTIRIMYLAEFMLLVGGIIILHLLGVHYD